MIELVFVFQLKENYVFTKKIFIETVLTIESVSKNCFVFAASKIRACIKEPIKLNSTTIPVKKNTTPVECVLCFITFITLKED